ncbi:DUF2867 domain-containing protein [Deinococcus hopiensis]|uniref:DUF2867 domain-containing protein n=1 Tax=Deinococcus hopiensis KR-140 TaxID=695939 RepID=A0A1W1V621_9DEIO|nr:DUF2867 domain-containing protein [Deinococcus hopiensis]SMB88847.1 Protein of unknown function [Deinococcus hopiensis KR-140]
MTPGGAQRSRTRSLAAPLALSAEGKTTVNTPLPVRLPPQLLQAVASADHTDALTTESDVDLLPFIQRMLSFQPGWIQALYRVRVLVLRVLGHRTGVPPQGAVPEQMPTQPGQRAAFFFVEEAGETYWTARASEAHLTARLAVLQSPGQTRRHLYRVVTVVHFHSMAGRVYFALIQPFHFLVVRAMMRHGGGAQ